MGEIAPSLETTISRMVEEIEERKGKQEWFDRIKPEAIEDHGQTRVVRVKEWMASTAIIDHPIKCPYAIALRNVDGVEGSCVYERVAYTLELKDGEPVVYKFAVPNEANHRLLAFDLSHHMEDHEMAFQPLTPSRTKVARRQRKERKAEEKPPKGWAGLRPQAQAQAMGNAEKPAKPESRIEWRTVPPQPDAAVNRSSKSDLPPGPKQPEPRPQAQIIQKRKQHPRWRWIEPEHRQQPSQG